MPKRKFSVRKPSRLRLERELPNLLGRGRDAQIVARYYGFDGLGGGTLRSVGNEFGLTRERVRQVAAAASRRFSGGRPFAPTLDKSHRMRNPIICRQEPEKSKPTCVLRN
jgi:hypothetical protein